MEERVRGYVQPSCGHLRGARLVCCPQAGVGPGRERLREQIAGDHEDGTYGGSGHDHRIVTCTNRLDHDSPYAGPGEYRFDEHRAREKRRQREPEQCQHWYEGVPEHVTYGDLVGS